MKYQILRVCGVENACILQYLILLRRCEYYNNNKSILSKFLKYYHKARYSRLGLKLNIKIPLNTVGYGLRIHHVAGGGGCLLNCKSMGNYCGINSSVILGNNKERFDIPIIGDNVILNTGCKVFGNNVIIGVNAVVTKDVPPITIVYGIPAKVIKTRFSTD